LSREQTGVVIHGLPKKQFVLLQKIFPAFDFCLVHKNMYQVVRAATSAVVLLSTNPDHVIFSYAVSGKCKCIVFKTFAEVEDTLTKAYLKYFPERKKRDVQSHTI